MIQWRPTTARWTWRAAHLADEDGEEEVVDEEGLRVRLEVVAEEEVREHDDQVLLRRVGEAAAEHLDAADHHHHRRHAATTRSVSPLQHTLVC